MSTLEESLVDTEIPTDNESEDNFENSESEDVLCGTNEEIEVDDNSNNESEEDDTPLSIRVVEIDGIWEKKKKFNFNPQFSELVGPQNFPENIALPGQVFLCLFSEQNVDLIVEQSNLYCEQTGKDFEAITREEVQKFLGINLIMGVKKLPSYRDFWSSNPQVHDTYISSIMSVNRFSFLLSHLHLSDNSNEPKRNKPGFDKLYKVAPTLNILSESYKRYCKPTMNQSIDESMIKFKGRSVMKQYMPMKPIKRGYKVWVRADQHGYICEFQIYTGKVMNQKEIRLGERVVKDLSRDLVHKNYRIYFDNYFTTVALMSSLLSDGILACGTVRKDRKDLPKIQEAVKKMSPGESEFRTSYTGVRWLKWIDKKPVYFLSNHHDPSLISVVNRRQKDGTLKEVTCPKMAKDYNTYMGCVDKADMLKSFYEISRKSKKWWHRIFWHFVDITVVNSFIIYRQLFPDQRMSLKDFRLSVADHLIGVPVLPKQRGRPSLKPLSIRQKPKVPHGARTGKVAHLPGVQNTRKRCVHCSTKANEKRTKFYCLTCQVPLCIEKENSCFQSFHK